MKPEHNDYVVVSNEEEEATFKQLKNYGRTRVLHPLSLKYDDIELSRETEYRENRTERILSQALFSLFSCHVKNTT